MAAAYDFSTSVAIDAEEDPVLTALDSLTALRRERRR
jgi:hypothetical protein